MDEGRKSCKRASIIGVTGNTLSLLKWASKLMKDRHFNIVTEHDIM